ncbi:XrtA/PEP-CTERM system TPR-repeat protein PrsT [Desertibaculum subflavum]|uniref:XrtA/PEP-CTERM system TPR-repeat protein PrsT n=1 Tax=Desertibaculum subflavum TaxID=2268458 RepID=UPI000E666BBA
MKLERSAILISLRALVVGCALAGAPAWADRAESDKYLSEGRKQIEKGDFRSAIIQLKNAVRADGNNLEARRALGMAQLAVGDLLSAEKELGIFVEKAPDDASAIVPYGEAMLQLRRYDDVIARLEPKGRPKDIDAQVLALRGHALAATGRTDQAIQAFDESLKLQPTVRAHLGYALVLRRTQGIERAGAEIDKALAIDPKSPEAALAKAELLRDAGKFDEALPFADQAAASPRLEVPARLARIPLYIRQGKDDRATADVNAVLGKVKDQPLATYFKALLAARANNLDGAQQILQGLSPEFIDNYPPALFLSGVTSYSKGQLDVAEGRLRSYVNKIPSNVAARKILGSIYLRKGDATKALAMLEPALKTAPNDPRLLGLLGTASERLGKSNDAVAYFERATEQDPEDAGLQTQLALGKLRTGQTDEAIEALEGVVDKNPGAVRATSALLAAHIRGGAYDKAMAEVADLRKRTPDAPLPDYYEGAVLVAKRDLAGGRQAFEAALKKDPKFHAARFALARVYVAEGDRDKAVGQIAKVLEADPGNERAILDMAELQASGGKLDDAIATLDKARRADAKTVNVRLKLVDAYLAKKEGERALVVARETATMTGGTPQALDALGRAQSAVGDKASAIGTYRQIVAQLPQSGAALQRLAGALLLNDDVAGAKQALLQAARVDPAFAPAQQDYVRLAAREGGADAAIAAAKELKENAPSSAVAPVLLGESYVQAKKYGEAVAVFRQIRTEKPSNAILIREAEALNADKKGAEARNLLEGWLKDNAGDQAVRLALAGMHLQAKNEPAAITQYEAVLAAAPNNVLALNNLAWSLRERDGARAVTLAARAAELAPNAAEVLDTYGWLLVLRNEPAKAIEPLQKAASIPNAPAPVRYHLAAALAGAGRKDEARRILDEVLAANASFDERADAEALRRKLAN